LQTVAEGIYAEVFRVIIAEMYTCIKKVVLDKFECAGSAKGQWRYCLGYKDGKI